MFLFHSRLRGRCGNEQGATCRPGVYGTVEYIASLPRPYMRTYLKNDDSKVVMRYIVNKNDDDDDDDRVAIEYNQGVSSS